MPESGNLNKLKNKYQGQRCVLMGNGPSINRMDMNRFQGEKVWTANRSFSLFERIDWKPAFYVSHDPRVIQNSRDLIKEHVHKMATTQFFLPLWTRTAGLFTDSPDVIWFEDQDFNPENESSFGKDVSQGVLRTRTVTLISIQFAIYAGFNPIYLIGCDMSYTPPSKEQVVIREGEKLMTHSGQDTDHFDPGYLKGGELWKVPDAAGMLEDFEKVARLCQKLGVVVYNATLGGNLEVFPRADYEQVFAARG